jgi:hypothetical protein
MDLRIRSTATETFEFNDNRALQAVSAGNSYNTISSLLFDVDARTPATRFNVNSNLSYRTFAGPGEENTKNVLEKSVNGKFEQTEKLTTYNVVASWREFDTATVQLEETGIATLSGTTVSQSVGGGLKHKLTPRDTIAWQTTWSSTVPQGGTSFEALSSTVNLSHSVNAFTSLDQSIVGQHLTYSNRPDIMFWTTTSGIKIQPIRPLTIRGAVGASFVDANSKTTVPSPATVAGGTELDWLANVSVNYDVTRQMKLGFTAARSTSPNTFGQFSTSESLGASLTYEVTREARVFMAASFTQQTFVGASPTQNSSASISYVYRLARDWSTRTTYQFAQRHSNISSAHSNSLLFVLTRDYIVLP